MKRKAGKKLKNNNNIKKKWNENKFKINKLIIIFIYFYNVQTKYKKKNHFFISSLLELNLT